MKYLRIILAFLLSSPIYAQTFYAELYGFKLGQYREAARNELGQPFKSDKYEDGFEYEAFLLKPDTSLYIVFEYAAGKTNIIWSIQVSGKESSTEIGLKNVKLGIDKIQTEKIFGKPSSIDNIGQYGFKWAYNETNLSVEISTKGKLSSVKILDRSNELFPSPDFKKIPTFEEIRRILTSSNNSEIINLFSGDIEIYKNGKTYFLKKSCKTEQLTDYSGLIAVIKEITNDLSLVDTKNKEDYQENLRVAHGQDTKYVIKLGSRHKIREIVLKYYGGRHLIYEIKAT